MKLQRIMNLLKSTFQFYSHVISVSMPPVIVQAEANNAQYQLSLYLPEIFSFVYSYRLKILVVSQVTPIGSDLTLRTTANNKVAAFSAADVTLSSQNVIMAQEQPEFCHATQTWVFRVLGDNDVHVLFKQLSILKLSVSVTNSMMVTGKVGGANDDLSIAFIFAIFVMEVFYRKGFPEICFKEYKPIEDTLTSTYHWPLFT